jgi:hypothetical protein
MDNEALAKVRARAQDAMSRARLASDPALQKEWEELADAWSALLAEWKAKAGDPKGSEDLIL